MKAAKALAGALFLVLSVVAAKAEEQAGQGLETLFSITMTNLQGEPMTLSRFRGKPLIINFWARICPPCREEIPELVALQAEYRQQGLIVLGVALEDDPGKVREFLAAYGADYPAVLVGEQGHSLMTALGNDGSFLPFTLVIDRRGEIVLRKRGLFRKSDFLGVVGKVLR